MDHNNFLKERFGFSHFRPGQWEIIECALKQKNVLGVLATGTGKTLCYQYASEWLKGLTIVVSPLIALMEDQVARLRKEGHKNVGVLHSSLSKEEFFLEWSLFQAKRRSILFISPERLCSRQFLREISHHRVSLLVIDEAHCISQWGYDFRPDYLYIPDTYVHLGYPPVMALTATASSKVQQDILDKLKIVDATRIVLSMNRPNIAYFVQHVEQEKEKLDFLLTHLPKMQYPGIIYTNTRNQAESLAQWLSQHLDMNVLAYHAGLRDDERMMIQNQFISGQTPLLVATSAFGMGIDKENIRFVIHYQMPGGIERYLQETGRIGRDGKEGVAILLFRIQDVEHTKSVITSSLPTESQLYQIVHDFYTQSLPEIENREEYEHLPIKSIFLQLVSEGWIEEDPLSGRVRLVKKLNRKDIAQIAKLWEERRKQKEEMVELFVTAIEQHSCIRKGLLHILDEKDEHYSTYCCSKCGLDISYYYSNLSYKSMNDTKVGSHWLDELHKLLPIQNLPRTR